MLRTLDRHVLKEWLTIFLIVLGATFGLLFVGEVYDSFPFMLENGATRADMLRYYLVVSPSLLAFVVPVSVLVSLLYALGLLHRHNEIIAMRSAGVGIWRITRWIWIVVAGLSALQFYLNSSVVPWSVKEARLLKDNVRFNHEAAMGTLGTPVGLVRNLGYVNRQAGRVWMISRFSEATHQAYGIQVSELDETGMETRRILAAEGFWDEVDGKWVFLRGQEVFSPRSGEEVRPVRFDRLELAGWNDDPRWMLTLLERPKDLSLDELAKLSDSPDTELDPRRPSYAVQYHALIAGSFSCLIVAGLAVPFAVSGVRVNPAVGVTKSIGLFFLFYLLLQSGMLLGGQKVVDPRLAAWMPNLFMMALAGWLMIRER